METDSTLSRLIERTALDPDTGCLVWTGATNGDGYGSLRWDGRTQRAHRVAWALVHGEIAPGYSVCHRCDNPACIRVDHLFLGTHAENMRDMAAKGRARSPLPAIRRAATHCHRGHEFDEANTYWDARGQRVCRKCQALRTRAYKLRRQQATP